MKNPEIPPLSPIKCQLLGLPSRQMLLPSGKTLSGAFSVPFFSIKMPQNVNNRHKNIYKRRCLFSPRRGRGCLRSTPGSAFKGFSSDTLPTCPVTNDVTCCWPRGAVQEGALAFITILHASVFSFHKPRAAPKHQK